MKNDTADRGWQELQARIEQLQKRYLSGAVQAIEYKPGRVLQLLEMPSKYVEKHPGVK